MVRLQRTNDATLGSRQTAKNPGLNPQNQGCNFCIHGIFNFGGSDFKRNIFGEKVVQTYIFDFISLKGLI
jgi:hypothetical protein